MGFNLKVIHIRPMCRELKFYRASSDMLQSGNFEVGNFNWCLYV